MIHFTDEKKQCDHCGTWVSYYHPVCAQCGRDHPPDWGFKEPSHIVYTEEELEEKRKQEVEQKQKEDHERSVEQVKTFWTFLIFIIFMLLIFRFVDYL